MGADNLLRISVILWQIPASANRYPPAGADLAEDGHIWVNGGPATLTVALA
ncbi:hypothetical protein PGTUg99_034689 [Puccinia graminis f. sp. tritici]|uniref:Uncharacterized protein n=1 Tax=Puccinia graminis f. sp. tritici TaxID=56615 RepID=A0A5B0SMN1_PUCGR|nr:hypothetical protein PGTUg99_034689 [Puccinia graminis f. sp. tritici]